MNPLWPLETLLELPGTTFTELHHLPFKAGVYFVFDSMGHLVYIGQSKSIAARWLGFDKYGKSINGWCHKVFSLCFKFPNPQLWSVRWQLCPAEDTRLLERQYIKKFDPLLNKAS